jgi:hypothetical protein
VTGDQLQNAKAIDRIAMIYRISAKDTGFNLVDPVNPVHFGFDPTIFCKNPNG